MTEHEDGSLGRTIAGQINLKPMARKGRKGFFFHIWSEFVALNLLALQSTFKMACHGLFPGEI